ncbi:glycosyltransferase family 4 protein [Clostridium sp. UBA4548]|uniref:glycosyltransferase family 4 protein n=1 Tax=Clostridium sp. UBA4548 TaxID=1946361 RepID=UPI0025BED3EF|nr:glycosyltransferase family 4 protein [Clostridium sp. UBA4548]
MNIVHIEDFFHPDAGYQINILPKYMAKQGHKVTIVTSEMQKVPNNLTAFFGKEDVEERDLEYYKMADVNIIRVKIKGFISGRAVFSREMFKVIDKLKPDILYIHGNDTLTAMRYLIRLKKIKCPIVLDSHMLEMASINKFNKIFRSIYRKVFTPIIIKNKIPVIRTQNDPYVEKCLGIPLKQCPWISVGSDMLLFHPDKVVRTEFRRINNINEEDFVIVYTGKLDEAKGGMLLAKAFQKKYEVDRNIVLLVVGNTNGEYGKKIDEVFAKSENRIIRFPTQKYINLAKFYQSSDLSVFPRQCSLSFYDAQACGLPVVSENNNINIDRLQFNNGYNFKAEDVDDLRDKIMKCINIGYGQYKEIKHNAYEFVKSNYNYEEISNEYTKILLDEVQRFERE